MSEHYVVEGLGGFEAWYDLTKKIVRCRTSHPCCWCNETIMPGMEAEMSTHLFIDDDGRHFQRLWLHRECIQPMAAAADESQVEYECYVEWMNDIQPNYGGAA